jgi:hypothetical protein
MRLALKRQKDNFDAHSPFLCVSTKYSKPS